MNSTSQTNVKVLDNGVLWDDRTVRSILSTSIISEFAHGLKRHPTLMDIGSGLGTTPIATVMGGEFALSLGIDMNRAMISRARMNSARNWADKARFISHDVCQPSQLLREKFVTNGIPYNIRFDVVTMDAFSMSKKVVTRCVFDTIMGMTPDRFLYFDSDIPYQRNLRRYNYVSVIDLLLKAGGKVEYTWQVNMSSLFETDEDIFPVQALKLRKPLRWRQ